MRSVFRIFAVCAICLSIFSVPAQNRTKINFGTDWEFKISESIPTDWEKVMLPHTAKIEPLVVNNQFQGTFWYQKTFNAPFSKNQKVFLYFEGVMQMADIWINDQKVCSHTGGYLPFIIDITPYLNKRGKNIIRVKGNNDDNPNFPPGKPLNELDFNYYGGIYRNVYLITTDKLHITNSMEANKAGSGGLYVNFDSISKDNASGVIQTHIKNDYSKDKSVVLNYFLTDKNGKKLEFTSEPFTIKSNSDKEIIQKIQVKNPKLWSISQPNLYQLEVQIISNNQIIDSYCETIGIRKSEIRDDGYYLNNKKLFIRGTNEHQEYPYLGYAISDDAQYRDAVKIKNAGFDFVRMSHYPHAEAFMKACDELGILVMNSLTGWQFFGNEKFQENAIQDIRDMARRDRNHPSVIFWEASLNETGMSKAFMAKASSALKEELKFGNYYSACWIDNPNYDLFIPARQHAKPPNYWNNYANGNKKIFVAEYGDWEYYAQNAGFNQTQFSNLKKEARSSRQLRAHGEERLLQQAFNFQEAANSNRKGKNIIGDANWLMFDYNRGYSNDIESSGISDVFRIPKFSYYFYQSQRDANMKLNPKLNSGPMVKIASYWTEKSPLDLTVYSNCEEVALYLNDSLVTKKSPEITPYNDALKHPPFTFHIKKFIPGTLRAEGYLNGKKVAEYSVKTPQSPTKILLSYDLSSKEINPDFPDMVFVYAKITDHNGTLVPWYNSQISFSIDGEDAKLVGKNPIQAEAGIATIVLRTTRFKKPIIISAKGEGLEPAKLNIENKTKIE
ncbi:glycoside hydrolase family 2 TIM barrel-domain containing protein [Gaetbulibacter aestuarii]|uniref:Glycoside hydrolase family 2 TIM barrel-domain containing protein n=1 Tax=Gaetbulibacter aestuarii TaxID=1502358 RepID=A0ABW7N0S4_9FLAO